MENLARTEPGKQLINSLDTVRLIVIEGLDEQADGGTHVSITTEIGRLVLNKIQSKGKRNKRIEFTLETQ
jgi:misacylated tRNA(Ala) deacylase